MNMFLFSLIFLVIMVFIDYYTYRRFLAALFPSYTRALLVVPFLFLVSQVLFVVTARLNLISVTPPFYYTYALIFGVSLLLFIIALFYDITLTFAQKIPFDKSRRASIKIMFDITMIIATFSYLFEAISGGLKKPILNRVSIKIKNLKNLKIAQLTDMHVGELLQEDFVAECVSRINALDVDLVVITGDLIDGDIDELIPHLAPLKNLKSRYGTFYVNGNHEYYHGIAKIMQRVSELNIRVLDDESLLIDNRFNLVGLNDYASSRFNEYVLDENRAFRDVDENFPTIVLAHQPKMTRLLKDKKYDLMISGHTHGGQIFPFGFLVMIDQVYLAGLYQVSKTKQIFVSRGTGFWGPPVRILAPSEISILELFE